MLSNTRTNTEPDFDIAITKDEQVIVRRVGRSAYIVLVQGYQWTDDMNEFDYKLGIGTKEWEKPIDAIKAYATSGADKFHQIKDCYKN